MLKVIDRHYNWDLGAMWSDVLKNAINLLEAKCSKIQQHFP